MSLFQCGVSGMFIPDPGSGIPDPTFFHPGFKLSLKNMIRVVHPGSRILDPDTDFLPCRIPDPGFKKAPNPGSRIRIRNTNLFYGK
jgi:hypothetical protein